MIVWVLLVHLTSVSGTPMPYLAFHNQDDCEEALLEVRSNISDSWSPHADCVPFAADAPEVKR